jgi:hypothetical protein
MKIENNVIELSALLTLHVLHDGEGVSMPTLGLACGS